MINSSNNDHTVSSIQNAIYSFYHRRYRTTAFTCFVAHVTNQTISLESSDASPMLHTSPHSNDKSKYDAHSMTRNRFSFVGLQVETDLTPSTDDGRFILP